MHYYKFFIGDYRAATAHLSPLEHYIYRSLIDQLYLDERPIPLETRSVLRRLRLVTEDESAALDAVLDEFFRRTDEGWIHTRVMADIEDYQTQCDTNRANGKRGGRPKKTESVSVGLEVGTEVEPKHNPNQEPLTINQETGNKKQQRARHVALSCPPSVDDQVWQDFTRHRKAKGAPITETALRGIEREAAAAGVSLQAALETCCQRGWTGFKAEWVRDQARPQAMTRQQAQDANNDDVVRRFKERVLKGSTLFGAGAGTIIDGDVL